MDRKLRYTPGPWTVTKDKTQKIFSISGKGWENFATVFRIEADDEENSTDFMEAEDNANLIASAPDLLEALQELTELHSEEMETATVTTKQWYNAVLKGEAAINKALGK